MAGGAKDGTIARRLNLSERSVRRQVEALAQRSGASNRFTLALAAIRIGWLPAGRRASPRSGAGPPPVPDHTLPLSGTGLLSHQAWARRAPGAEVGVTDRPAGRAADRRERPRTP